MTSENNLVFQIHLDLPDILHANRVYRASTSPDYAGGPMLGVIALLLGVIYSAFLLTQPLDTRADRVWGFAGAITLLFVGLVFTFDLIPTLFLWLVFRRNRQFFSETYRVVFDENGMLVQNQNVNAQYKWSFFKAGLEGRREFILIYSNISYYVIPKDCIRSEREIELFRAMLQRSLVTFKQNFKIPMDFRG